MKLKLVFLLFLCLNFCLSIQAQIIRKHIPPPTSLKALRVGDHISDTLLLYLTRVLAQQNPVPSSPQLTGKGQLLLLDFWATWCAPCRTMLPKLNRLQAQYRNRLVILPVTYQDRATVMPIWRKILPQSHLPLLTGDTRLQALFPHRTLPHEVWINGEGVVLAITGEEEVTAATVDQLLARQPLHLAEKKDITVSYDATQPLLAGGNGGKGADILYHSLLTGFIPGLTGGLTVTPYDSVGGQQFSVRNVPFIWLCRLAFAGNGNWFSDARIHLLSRDSARLNSALSGAAYEAWLADGKGYCYELKVPPRLAPSAFSLIQQDLKRLFPQYLVQVESQPTPVLALVRTSKADKLKTKGGALQVEITPVEAHLRNAHLSQLFMRLDRQYLQNSAVPLVDETGYTGRVDLDLNASLSNLRELNRALAAYDLQLVRKTAIADFLVIADTPSSVLQPQPVYP